MKSILLFCGALVLCTLLYSAPSYCQGVIIKGGINLSDFYHLSNYDDGPYYTEAKTKAKIGYNFGIGTDLYRTGNNSFLAISLSPYYIHHSIDKESISYNLDYSQDTSCVSTKLSINFIHIPIYLKYIRDFSSFKIGAFIGAGRGILASNQKSEYINKKTGEVRRDYYGSKGTRTLHYDCGLTAIYKSFTADLSYSKIFFGEMEGASFEVHSVMLNVGYVIYATPF
ncbi:MAG TPA: hypothetical protein VHO28_00515 [Ignavibacteriales bacterium]|nr:hypothetical protein [Ignavibacteriales bacterium]